MTEPTLPPAAQAVSDAYFRYALGKEPSFEVDLKALAAALRAAADQVVPDQGDVRTQDLRARAWIRFEECERIRRKFLAIADELEGAQ
jgi:hypothetical protein